jgi:autophagy-related protein 18
MNFNLVGSLLAVSSERGTVHVFRLGSGQGDGRDGVKAVGAGASASSSPTTGSGGSARGWDSASSPPESVDGTMQGLDGGYDAFIEKKKSASVSCVLFFSLSSSMRLY